MFRKKLTNTSDNVTLLTNVSTGPDSCNTPFYGTNNFKTSGVVHLEDSPGPVKLFEESNIYFVRAVRYEISKDGSFMLLVEHFEDNMLSVYTYRLGPKDGRALRRRYPGMIRLKLAFGKSNGGDVFLRYCYRKKFNVCYTKYWL